MKTDAGKQTLFFIGLSLLFLLYAALSAHAQDKAADLKALNYLQYHQEAAKIDDKAHTVNLDQFLDLMKKKHTVIVDLRSPAEYEHEHIQGAIQFGADISKEKLEKLIPAKDTTILLYCSFSLEPTRMIALTNVSLPQFILQGYPNTYKLGPIWESKGNWQDSEKEMSRLPMVKKGQP